MFAADRRHFIPARSKSGQAGQSLLPGRELRRGPDGPARGSAGPRRSPRLLPAICRTQSEDIGSRSSAFARLAAFVTPARTRRISKRGRSGIRRTVTVTGVEDRWSRFARRPGCRRLRGPDSRNRTIYRSCQFSPADRESTSYPQSGRGGGEARRSPPVRACRRLVRAVVTAAARRTDREALMGIRSWFRSRRSEDAPDDGGSSLI